MKRSLIIALLILFGIQFFIGLAYSIPKILQKLNMPGELAKEHAEYEDDCEKCHVAWKGVKDERCLECHEEIKKQIDSKKGLHFTKFKGTCASCHPDHKGRDFKMIDFDESKFQHEETGYELISKHARLKCKQCHASEGKQKIEPQPKIGRYIGLQTDCLFCHQKDDEGEKGHRGQLGDGCDKCHTEKAWKPSTFDHQKSKYPLEGKHEKIECVKCHPDGKYRGLETDCFSCHQKDDSHKGGLSQDCASCHTNDGWKPSTYTVKRHAKSKFPLRGEHYNVECGKCHVSKRYKGIGTECFDCHEKTDREKGHKGELGERCDKCHTNDAWKPTNFDLKRHDELEFKLLGKHRKAKCEKCHTDGRYKGLSAKCIDCHKKDEQEKGHKGQLGDECERCHRTEDWKPSTFTELNHQNTEYPLDGRHIDVRCSKCHRNNQYKKLDTSCYACHKRKEEKDGHRGQLGKGCEDCHTVYGWEPSTFDIEKHNLLDFKLTGEHAETKCQKCHTKGRYKELDATCVACHKKDDEKKGHKGELGRDCFSCHTVWSWKDDTFTHDISEYKLIGEHLYVECAKCHPKRKYKDIDKTCRPCHISDDKKVHDGRLEKGCEDCHTVYGWEPSTFDLEKHNLLDFKLTGEHAETKCQKCHIKGRYKNLDATCIACHKKNDEKKGHRGELGQDCSSCHTVWSWKDSIFTHDMSEYKLTGEHLFVECAKCHPKRRHKKTPQDCYSCHISDDKKAHDEELGKACESCHRTEGWKPSTYLHSEREIKRVKKSRLRPLVAWLLPERITPKDNITTYKYELKGKHANLKCEQCHKNNRYKATEPDCVSCHAKNDKHVKGLGRDCERCHTPNGWDVISFDHRLAAFPLRGEHARLPCNSCHQSNQYKETSRRCQHCHAGSIPHADDINSDCETCHTSAFGWKVVIFNHNQSRFPLRHKHKTVKCWDCHREDTFEGLSKECFTCHEDIHKGEFGSKCEICHSEMAWKPASFNHTLTGFPLTGRHVAADCTDCHLDGRYQGTPKDCYSCHQQDVPDAHYGIRCDDCHTPSSWKGAMFKHTAFPINTGKHRKADCVDCHPVKDFHKEFTCIGGGCHPKNKMDKKHRKKRGYVYDSMACFKCHPTGKEEKDDDD